MSQTSRDRNSSRRLRTHEKNSGDMYYCIIGHNNTKHFFVPNQEPASAWILEMVRWESVPRGSFARAWKLSSRLFTRPDWLPLGFRGKTRNAKTMNVVATEKRQICIKTKLQFFEFRVCGATTRISSRITSFWRHNDVICDEIRAIAPHMPNSKNYNFDLMQLCLFSVANTFTVFAFKYP